jgi:hypothetical protein
MRADRVSANSGQSRVDRSSAIRKADRETQRGASIEELHLAGGTCARGCNRDIECKIVVGGLLRVGYGQGGVRSDLIAASTAA